MTVGRAQRGIEREPRVRRHFAEPLVEPALDLLELFEIAWHDCYGDITPTEDIVDDGLTASEGDLAGLIRSARLAITDWRDLKMKTTAPKDRP